MHGVHKTTQTAFRLPEGLLASLKEAAGQDRRTATDCVSEAIAEWLDRRSGITTSALLAGRVSPPPKRPRRTDSAPAATFRPPAQSPDCPHPKARINKGLCGACGTNVGTRAG